MSPSTIQWYRGLLESLIRSFTLNVLVSQSYALNLEGETSDDKVVPLGTIFQLEKIIIFSVFDSHVDAN
jgi:hypothetical protein